MQTLETLKQNWQAINWTVVESTKTAVYLRRGLWDICINEDMFNTNGIINRKEYRMIGKTMDYLRQIANNNN